MSDVQFLQETVHPLSTTRIEIMASFSAAERRFLRRLSELTYCNPFETRRLELEEAVLGKDYTRENLSSWSRTEATDRHERPNVVHITARAEKMAESLCGRGAVDEGLSVDDRELYEDLVSYVLYYRHIVSGGPSLRQTWDQFCHDRCRFLGPLRGEKQALLAESAHVFACLHQVRRAFKHIFDYLIGESLPATRLRAQVWQSIFTHDLKRYRRTLYRRMADLSTLVTGPSGAGKELVARAIGLSQYQAFDPNAGQFMGQRAHDTQTDGFVALNLSALSPTLIESELFGHRRGAFTGATSDHAGWFECCPNYGAVFLDEIGELEMTIQVKLLRVVQTRTYSRLGESVPRPFHGKLLAATNRDLAVEMRAGRFREDLYYRLCSDRIEVPSLSEHLADRPEALGGLVHFLVRRMMGESSKERECDGLAQEVETWIATGMPRDYHWPGNIRELEQCVRSVLVRREYHPASFAESVPASWWERARQGELSADELLNAYCRHVYGKCGGYEPAARVLGLDRRTIKGRVERSSGS